MLSLEQVDLNKILYLVYVRVNNVLTKKEPQEDLLQTRVAILLEVFEGLSLVYQ